jgi:outer membrane protein assembly factor BamB
MSAPPQPKPAAPKAENADPTAIRLWRMTAWIAGLFSLVVGFVMVLGHLQGHADLPLQSPQLKQQKEKLRLAPSDESLKQRIRQLDLQLRQRYFRLLSQSRSGVYLLALGAILFAVSVNQISRLQKRRPRPDPRLSQAQQAARAVRIRWSVAASGVSVGAFLLILSLGRSTPLPKDAADLEKTGNAVGAVAAAPPLPSPEEVAQNWPQFRGPNGRGVSTATNAPTAWDVKTGSGIAWKSPVPASGFSSPVVWGNKMFLSGGNAAQREVFCLDAQTGALLWRQPVASPPGVKPAEVPDSTGYAASTMATDGRRVYVIFATGDLAAFTLDGKPVWSKGLGPLKNPYGHATSLAILRDQLVLQLDQAETEDGKSILYAIDGSTGKVLWQKPRKVPASWASPILIEAAGKTQIIALAGSWVIAYSATDGSELWRVECLTGEVLPSPAFADGLLFIASPSEKLLAIRPEGQGDVTKTHVAWTEEENVPDIASPVSNGELLFTLSTGGMLTCIDPKDGKKVWEHDFDMEFHASPIVAGNRIYLFSQKGTAFVVEAARQFKEVLHTEMGDSFQASPAFAANTLFLRGVTNLWAIRASASLTK